MFSMRWRVRGTLVFWAEVLTCGKDNDNGNDHDMNNNITIITTTTTNTTTTTTTTNNNNNNNDSDDNNDNNNDTSQAVARAPYRAHTSPETGSTLDRWVSRTSVDCPASAK